MFYQNRTWSVSEVSSSKKLAEMLTQQTWSRCDAFFVAGHRSVLFLNDSQSFDEDQEYAVMYRNRHGIIGEIDSITVNSVAAQRIAWLIDQFLELPGETVRFGSTIRPEQLESPEQHRRHACPLCA